MIANTQQICKNTKKEGAHKICVSSECSISNPFICDKCEEQHQHGGTLVAVRIKKIQQIQHKITNKKQKLQNCSRNIQSCLNAIKSKLSTWMSQIANQQNILTQIQQQLDLFFGEKEFNFVDAQFSKTWNKIKGNDKVIEVTGQLVEYGRIANKLEAVLNNKVDPQIPQNKQNLTNNEQSNEFLTNFSNVFLFSNLQLQNNPKPDIIHTIKNIHRQLLPKQFQQSNNQRNRKNQFLCLAKLCEVYSMDQQAEVLYNQLLSQSMMDAETLNRRALLRKKMQKYNEAYQDLSELITLIHDKINSVMYFGQRAQISRLAENWQKAEKDYLKCLENQNNTQVQYYKKLAEVNQKQGKYKEAIQFLKKYLSKIEGKNQPEILQTYSLIAQSAKKMGDKETELEYLNVIKSRNAEDLQIILKRAPLNHSLGNYFQAYQAYTKAIQKVPDNSGLYYNRAISLVSLGKKEAAISDLIRASKIDPSFKQALSLLANLAFQSSTSELSLVQNKETYKKIAIDNFTALSMIEPENHINWHNLGILYTDSNLKKSYEAYTQAIKIKSEFMSSYVGRMKVSLNMGMKPEETLKDIYQAIALGNRNAQVFHIKAILEEQIKQYQKALNTMNLVLQADPQKSEYIQTKIRLLIKLQRKQELAAELGKLQQIAPERISKYIKEEEPEGKNNSLQ